MRRYRYLIAYVIADPRRWRRVYRALLGFGEAVQYSVFVADLTIAELGEVRRVFERVLVEGQDRALIVRLGDPSAEGLFEFYGGDVPGLPTGGPAIF